VSDTTYQADPRYKRKPARLICRNSLEIIRDFFERAWVEVSKWKDFRNTEPSPKEIIARDGNLNSTLKMQDSFRVWLCDTTRKKDDYLVTFGQDWTIFINQWDNKNERFENKESILVNAIRLSSESAVVFAKYDEKLEWSWAGACSATKIRAENIWENLQTINKQNLSPRDFKKYCDQIEEDVEEIENVNPFLRCFYNTPALRFAETYWPETCYYLKNKNWTQATRMYVDYNNVLLGLLDHKTKPELRPSDHFSKGLSIFR
jgi:hypothetical protein